MRVKTEDLGDGEDIGLEAAYSPDHKDDTDGTLHPDMTTIEVRGDFKGLPEYLRKLWRRVTGG